PEAIAREPLSEEQKSSLLTYGADEPLLFVGHYCSDGYTRAFFRTKFWVEDEAPRTYGDIVFQPDALPEAIAREPLSEEQKSSLLTYGADEPLLFVGHY
ncbi:hypothetical protein ACLXAZ_33255, partial [Escherichia coli]